MPKIEPLGIKLNLNLIFSMPIPSSVYREITAFGSFSELFWVEMIEGTLIVVGLLCSELVSIDERNEAKNGKAVRTKPGRKEEYYVKTFQPIRNY